MCSVHRTAFGLITMRSTDEARKKVARVHAEAAAGGREIMEKEVWLLSGRYPSLR